MLGKRITFSVYSARCKSFYFNIRVTGGDTENLPRCMEKVGWSTFKEPTG